MDKCIGIPDRHLEFNYLQLKAVIIAKATFTSSKYGRRRNNPPVPKGVIRLYNLGFPEIIFFLNPEIFLRILYITPTPALPQARMRDYPVGIPTTS